MTDALLIPAESRLPARIPDLVAAGDAQGRFRVVRVSPQLARLAGAEAAAGRALDRLWPESLPSLAELAQEAEATERPIDNVLLRLRPGLPLLLVDVEPAGLTEDYAGRLVHVRFRPAPAAPATVGVVSGLVGASAALREVLRKLELYAVSDAAVVVTGETGTGKELVTRALHDRSPRASGPFVAVNCTAIATALLESELFGHEKGAFTGALRSHRGRFERAHTGTLFLDEIGDLPLHTQAKLLRVLEDGRVERVGSERELRVDVRVVAATNVPLEAAVAAGRFRADLYHRLAVLRLHLPPLRERLEDLPLLVAHFLENFNRKYGREVRRLTPEALHLLQSYLWPGNVRELRNVLEGVYVENRAEVIGARAFAEWLRERQRFAPGGWEPQSSPLIAAPYQPAAVRKPGSTRPADLDADEIRNALAAAQGNLAGAARLLGVHRATLYRYMARLGLSRNGLETG